MPESPYLRRPEAARYARVSTATLDRMIRSGDLPAVREGAIVLIDRRDIDALFEARKADSRAALAPA